MAGVEFVVIFAVRTLDFSVVARSVWANELVFYAKASQSAFKECRLIFLGGRKAVCKFKTIVRLNALNCDTAPLKLLHDQLGEIC